MLANQEFELAKCRQVCWHNSEQATRIRDASISFRYWTECSLGIGDRVDSRAINICGQPMHHLALHSISDPSHPPSIPQSATASEFRQVSVRARRDGRWCSVRIFRWHPEQMTICSFGGATALRTPTMTPSSPTPSGSDNEKPFSVHVN